MAFFLLLRFKDCGYEIRREDRKSFFQTDRHRSQELRDGAESVRGKKKSASKNRGQKKRSTSGKKETTPKKRRRRDNFSFFLFPSLSPHQQVKRRKKRSREKKFFSWGRRFVRRCLIEFVSLFFHNPLFPLSCHSKSPTAVQ